MVILIPFTKMAFESINNEVVNDLLLPRGRIMQQATIRITFLFLIIFNQAFSRMLLFPLFT